jgi:hypothetical protein
MSPVDLSSTKYPIISGPDIDNLWASLRYGKVIPFNIEIQDGTLEVYGVVDTLGNIGNVSRGHLWNITFTTLVSLRAKEGFDPSSRMLCGTYATAPGYRHGLDFFMSASGQLPFDPELYQAAKRAWQSSFGV